MWYIPRHCLRLVGRPVVAHRGIVRCRNHTSPWNEPIVEAGSVLVVDASYIAAIAAAERQRFQVSLSQAFKLHLVFLAAACQCSTGVAVFDIAPWARTRSRRRKLLPGYKHHRTRGSEGSAARRAGPLGASPLHRVAEESGFLVVQPRQGFEADDAIACVASHAAEAESLHAVVASGDSDMQQLLAPRVSWLQLHAMPDRAHPHGLQLHRYDAFLQKWGFQPSLLPDFTAMVGKKDSRIGGCGIGARSACELLVRFGGLERILSAGAAGELKSYAPRVRAVFVPVRGRGSANARPAAGRGFGGSPSDAPAESHGRQMPTTMRSVSERRLQGAAACAGGEDSLQAWASGRSLPDDAGKGRVWTEQAHDVWRKRHVAQLCSRPGHVLTPACIHKLSKLRARARPLPQDTCTDYAADLGGNSAPGLQSSALCWPRLQPRSALHELLWQHWRGALQDSLARLGHAFMLDHISQPEGWVVDIALFPDACPQPQDGCKNAQVSRLACSSAQQRPGQRKIALLVCGIGDFDWPLPEAADVLACCLRREMDVPTAEVQLLPHALPRPQLSSIPQGLHGTFRRYVKLLVKSGWRVQYLPFLELHEASTQLPGQATEGSLRSKEGRECGMDAYLAKVIAEAK